MKIENQFEGQNVAWVKYFNEETKKRKQPPASYQPIRDSDIVDEETIVELDMILASRESIESLREKFNGRTPVKVKGLTSQELAEYPIDPSEEIPVNYDLSGIAEHKSDTGFGITVINRDNLSGLMGLFNESSDLSCPLDDKDIEGISAFAPYEQAQFAICTKGRGDLLNNGFAGARLKRFIELEQEKDRNLKYGDVILEAQRIASEELLGAI